MRREVQKRAEQRKDGRKTVRVTIRFDATVYDDALTVSAKKKMPVGRFVNDVVRKALEEFWRAQKAPKAGRKSTKKQPPPSIEPRSRVPSAPTSKKRPEPPPSVVPRSRVPTSRKPAELLTAPALPSVPPPPSTKRIAGPSLSGSPSRASTPPRSGRSAK